MVTSFPLLLLGSMFAFSALGQESLNVTLESKASEYALRIPIDGTYGSNRYLVPNLVKSDWLGAVTYCTQIGGVLTDIQSLGELYYLTSMMAEAGINSCSFVGAAALGRNKAFVWISDGREIQNEFWNQESSDQTKGNCACLYWMKQYPGIGVESCQTDTRTFICKFQA